MTQIRDVVLAEMALSVDAGNTLEWASPHWWMDSSPSSPPEDQEFAVVGAGVAIADAVGRPGICRRQADAEQYPLARQHRRLDDPSGTV